MVWCHQLWLSVEHSNLDQSVNMWTRYVHLSSKLLLLGHMLLDKKNVLINKTKVFETKLMKFIHSHVKHLLSTSNVPDYVSGRE